MTFNKVFCLFEQSGTFKLQFKRLGFDCFDIDIRNDFNETDLVCDIFQEIKKYKENTSSIFDNILKNDLVFAFFPCVRFECQCKLFFDGTAYQMKNWSDRKKVEYAKKLHKELSFLYENLCDLVLLAYDKEFSLILENPYNQPHYLTSYFPLKPSVVDYNRREDGDYYKKPTQYYFINCSCGDGFIFECLEYVKPLNIEKCPGGKNRQIIRSLISPQYAYRFIKKYII